MRPIKWDEEKIEILALLLDRYLDNDELFEDEQYQEIAEMVPTVVHFVAMLRVKWKKIVAEYPCLNDIEQPPCRSTILKMSELDGGLEMLSVIQERGLLYGGLAGQITGNVVNLMLMNHGYNNKFEVTNTEPKPLVVREEKD